MNDLSFYRTGEGISEARMSWQETRDRRRKKKVPFASLVYAMKRVGMHIHTFTDRESNVRLHLVTKI